VGRPGTLQQEEDRRPEETKKGLHVTRINGKAEKKRNGTAKTEDAMKSKQ
jgi:hypothetical protein